MKDGRSALGALRGLSLASTTFGQGALSALIERGELLAQVHALELSQLRFSSWSAPVELAGRPLPTLRSLDLSGLRARQFAAADFARFDLILAMDRQNLRDIEALRPDGDETPVLLFGDLGPGGDVPDPYYTRDFHGCLDMIEACAVGLSRRYPAMRR